MRFCSLLESVIVYLMTAILCYWWKVLASEVHLGNDPRWHVDIQTQHFWQHADLPETQDNRFHTTACNRVDSSIVTKSIANTKYLDSVCLDSWHCWLAIMKVNFALKKDDICNKSTRWTASNTTVFTFRVHVGLPVQCIKSGVLVNINVLSEISGKVGNFDAVTHSLWSINLWKHAEIFYSTKPSELGLPLGDCVKWM